MIVRRRDACLIIDVCKDLEAKLWIFVQDLKSAWHCVTTIFFDKILVGQQPLEIDTDLFAAGRPRVARKNGAALGDELNEIVGHGASRAYVAGVIFAQYTTVRQRDLSGDAAVPGSSFAKQLQPLLGGHR